MKKHFLIGMLAFIFTAGTMYGQDIPQNQVPSLVINSFQQKFAKAYDIEWEMDGNNYKVEYESGLLRKDHEAWFDKTGKLLRHEQEISSSKLPQAVTTMIKKDYKGFSIDDVKMIEEGDKVIYKIELDSRGQDWKIAVDAQGKILSKIAD